MRLKCFSSCIKISLFGIILNNRNKIFILFIASDKNVSPPVLRPPKEFEQPAASTETTEVAEIEVIPCFLF